jgi:hypothetical protein
MTSLGPTRRSLLRGLVAMGCAALVPPIVALERKRRGYEAYQHTGREFIWSDFYQGPFELTEYQKAFLGLVKKPQVYLKCRQYPPLSEQSALQLKQLFYAARSR